MEKPGGGRSRIYAKASGRFEKETPLNKISETIFILWKISKKFRFSKKRELSTTCSFLDNYLEAKTKKSIHFF